MNKGLEIILARMESNPNEFIGPLAQQRWKWLTPSIEKVMAGKPVTAKEVDFLTTEDLKPLADKLREIKGQKFTERVVKQVCTQKPKTVRKKPKKTRRTLNIGTTATWYASDEIREMWTQSILEKTK